MLWAVMWGNLLGTVLRGRKLPGPAIKKMNDNVNLKNRINFIFLYSKKIVIIKLWLKRINQQD